MNQILNLFLFDSIKNPTSYVVNKQNWRTFVTCCYVIHLRQLDCAGCEADSRDFCLHGGNPDDEKNSGGNHSDRSKAVARRRDQKRAGDAGRIRHPQYACFQSQIEGKRRASGRISISNPFSSYGLHKFFSDLRTHAEVEIAFADNGRISALVRIHSGRVSCFNANHCSVETFNSSSIFITSF